jgi:hypothetical protein
VDVRSEGVKTLKIVVLGDSDHNDLLCMHPPLKDLTNFLINTKKMSIPHVSAICAIGLTTAATGYLTYTKIRLYEKRETMTMETMHRRAQLELDKDRFVFDKDRFAFDKDRFAFDKDRFAFDKDRFAFDKDRFAFDKDRFAFDKERDQHQLDFGRAMLGLNKPDLP